MNLTINDTEIIVFTGSGRNKGKDELSRISIVKPDNL